MALTKRSKYWHYDFIFQGKRHQGSTNQTNINKARLAVAAIRSNIALEAVGIAPPKLSPMMKDFMEGRFLDHVRQRNAAKPRTVLFYSEKVRRLLTHVPFGTLRLSELDEEAISDYALAQKTVAIATLNGDLRTLRKALNLALEWRLIPRKVKVRTLPGERQRQFVLSGELENRYLSLIDYPLKQAAILMLDLGLRPEECVMLRKADIQNGALTIQYGKTANAARCLPLTKRAAEAIALLNALWPDSEWLFPGRKGHIRRGSLDNLHTAVRKTHNLPADFVLYSLRHTFGTRLAESGASPFDVKAAMGHSSIVVTQRYVHPSGDHLRVALRQKEALDKMIRGEVPALSTTGMDETPTRSGVER